VDVEPGEEFDPNHHEALMRQPADDIASNHVTMQMQPGYVLGEKVIRPAQVGVPREGPAHGCASSSMEARMIWLPSRGGQGSASTQGR